MKRFTAILIALALILTLPLAISQAAGKSEKGDLIIASLTTTGEVGEIVKVNFELYANLPEDRKLDSLSGSMKYDPEFLTLGSINLIDEEQNLKSFMTGSGLFEKNTKVRGEFQFVFINPYGTSEQGFWFQAEFRVEKEGATAFVFNGITYTGMDSAYKTVTYTIDPVSVGGVYTEGYEVPADQPEETFEPLVPVIDTPAPPTDTPRPSGGGHDVPVTSSLPVYSAKPTQSGIVTPQPPVTSMPMSTPEQKEETPVPSQEPETPTPEPETPAPVNEPTVEPTAVPTTEDPGPIAEATPFAIGENDDPAGATDAPPVAVEPTVTNEPAQPSQNTDPEKSTEKEDNNDLWLIIGIAAGMVAVLGLGVIAIVLLMKRRKMNDRDRD